MGVPDRQDYAQMPSCRPPSFYLSSTTTFLTVAAAWFVNERVQLGEVVSDANADRFDFGNLAAKNFYKAFELAVKIAPKTPHAGYSKSTLWHSDGTKDGLPANGSSGRRGGGIFLHLEQELSSDGRLIGIVKWGRIFYRSALYEQQMGAYLLFYEPFCLEKIRNDLFGVAVNWVKATEEQPAMSTTLNCFIGVLLPLVDMTLSYQSVIRPALDPTNQHASAFSFRCQMAF